jgi:16S rRNA (guanine527-N7)-methyltransferase
MVSRETPVPPPPLPGWLEPNRAALTAFAGLLAEVGVERGLIGPREVPRLWERHLLNCAVVVEPGDGFIPAGIRVADVGSGAGLPGLVWAIVRPDLQIVLIEPLLRRSVFLAEAAAELGVADRVEVRRDRAEDLSRTTGWHAADVVTARAVAPLERLIGWTVPLLAPGGRLVALKGSSAAAELAEGHAAASAAGLVELEVREFGAGVVDPPTTVITGVRRAAQ